MYKDERLKRILHWGDWQWELASREEGDGWILRPVRFHCEIAHLHLAVDVTDNVMVCWRSCTPSPADSFMNFSVNTRPERVACCWWMSRELLHKIQPNKEWGFCHKQNPQVP